ASTAPAAAGVEAVVPSLQAFVAGERGLAFKEPVDVALLGGDAFKARLLEAQEEDLEEIRDAEAVLRAMGLLDPGVDLVAAVRSFSTGSVLGFYDTETKELVVRGAEATPFVRSVVVHELLHALEDQHFGLHRPDLGDEAYLGFQALAEGSAVRVEERYRASLSRRERASLAVEGLRQGARAPRDVPRVVQALFAFPYAYGPELVEAILGAGGQGRLDAAFADPPASTEHVLDPDSYLGGDRPRAVAVPAADGPPFDDGEIGELFLLLMLDAELDTADAARAADGWGGDRYVAWADGDRTCVRMDFVMDSDRDADELADALSRWAGERGPGATASGSSVRTCG
ncbi:MAG TPA: hypothetical protein VM263_04310, partial [Acidimicrobiales bacterium]|nr:hypothetical protein [Acidimicrobiales bacterium]